MTRRRMVFMLVLCPVVALFTVQALSEARSSNQSTGVYRIVRRQRTTDAERKRQAARRRALERQQRESAKESSHESSQSKLEREQRRKEARERMAKIRRELLFEKHALEATEEQWKVIKPKLEKVRHLRDRARSTVGLLMAGSSGGGSKTASGRSTNVPTMQWNVSWKDKAPSDLTEAQEIANELMALIDRRSASSPEFTRKMAALRQARAGQVELERQLSEARQELRSVLTTRQEAALVLMVSGWL